MRVMNLGMMLAAIIGAGAVEAEEAPRIGELGVCYEPIFGTQRDVHRPPARVLELYGNLKTGEVLGARSGGAGRSAVNYVASGRFLSSFDDQSHANGVDPDAPYAASFRLTYVRPASWISFRGEFVATTNGVDAPVQEVECYDRNVLPDGLPRSARYYVVGIASTTISPWGATPDLPDLLKPAADNNAIAQCAGATREGEYSVTYEPASNSTPLYVVLVTAHYRCQQ